MGADCDRCVTGYYGDGNTCTTCGNKKATPSGGAATASDCKCINIRNILVEVIFQWLVTTEP